MKFYSDVANELISNSCKRDETKLDYGCTQVIIHIDSVKKEKLFGKPKGEYFTLECSNLFALAPVVMEYMIENLAKYLQKKINDMLKKEEYKVLIVCLGNDNLVSDSLGAEVFDNLIVSHQSITNNVLYALKPSVYGKTNIKSVEHIQAMVKKLTPDICIIVDALCAKSISRLGTCVQVCDSGIVAGGAVNRGVDMILSKRTLGVPTLCIGSPLVVRVENILNEFMQDLSDIDVDDDNLLFGKYRNVVVAPKNIDEIVKQNGYMIASALNYAILKLNVDEQDKIR